MCGIAGICLITPNASLPDLRERLSAMTQAMQHRGPDDQGIYLSEDGRVGLANCRLAIRDLSPAGHMPMSNAAGSLWITYNGELYNAEELRPQLERLGYDFRSTSDTEVILHGYAAWGHEVVHHLRGMFAFALWDRRTLRGQVLIARDRLGIKPLFYARTSDAFVFASELKALLACGLVSREINPAAVVGYLLLGSVPNPLTIYRQIQGLEPAHTLILSAEAADLGVPVRYWSLPTESSASIHYADAVEQVQALLADAVRSHLVSDVPLGAFLSGGIDSSAVVMSMRQVMDGPIRTCSMVFEEAQYSEAGFACQVASAAGTEHYERVITAQDMIREWDRILWAMDQPTVDGVNSYFVSQTARQAGLTVAMSGLGGDELFGGYPNTFAGVPQMMRLVQRCQALPGGAWMAQTATRLLPNRQYWAKARDALARPATPASAYLARRGVFSPGEVQGLVKREVWEAARLGFEPLGRIGQGAGSNGHPDSLFSWVSRAELSMYTSHQLLRDTDVMSMAHSLEVRVPLLDDRLVEGVLRLPAAVKHNASRAKGLLLDALGERLPQSVRQRRDKQGFTFPFAVWMRSLLKSRVEALLRQENQASLLRPDQVQTVWDAYLSGRMHWSRAWALAALAAWSAS